MIGPSAKLVDGRRAERSLGTSPRCYGGHENNEGIHCAPQCMQHITRFCHQLLTVAEQCDRVSIMLSPRAGLPSHSVCVADHTRVSLWFVFSDLIGHMRSAFVLSAPRFCAVFVEVLRMRWVDCAVRTLRLKALSSSHSEITSFSKRQP